MDRQSNRSAGRQAGRQVVRQVGTARQAGRHMNHSKTQQNSIDRCAQALKTGNYLEAVHVVVLQIGGHGEAQLISVLHQQIPACLLTHPLLHELVASRAQTCK